MIMAHVLESCLNSPFVFYYLCYHFLWEPVLLGNHGALTLIYHGIEHQ